LGNEKLKFWKEERKRKKETKKERERESCEHEEPKFLGI
jgi:hypothetical protein